MSTQRPSKRKRGKGPLIIGDIETARVVTPKTIYEKRRDGTLVAKEVWVSLDKPTPNIQSVETLTEHPVTDYEPVDIPSPPPERPETYQSQRNYLQQYVERVELFMEALISREAMPEQSGTCRHCNHAVAVWRCRDCVMATPMCRACIRFHHREDPFHRIERWNGSYYRPAELSEAGAYLLIRHHSGEALCDTLKRWSNLLNSAELANDSIEQTELRRVRNTPGPSIPLPDADITSSEREPEFEAPWELNEDDIEGDDLGDGDEILEEDMSYFSNAGDSIDPALASATLGTRHRVVHTNGIHHITMVSCQCHGEDVLPLDLFASHLLPSSLKRIQTLFTAKVLDMYRLSNLELKASAYQFYQLLRRLTRPMAPAEVLNLYREFRRMSRIWRWMKKLKWAGYAGSSRKVTEVQPGELAIFCPACPQPGINIPDNWREDSARWVYKRIFVADGNFKADHVRQKNEVDDVWLSEGCGMIPSRHEYLSFLATAIEKLTNAPCENTFRAITNALQASKLCDITGVFSVACGRHGCYAPQALVDLFKGEQQKNADFSFLKGLKHTNVHYDQTVCLIYDIVCQYIVYLLLRIGEHLPPGLVIDAAIGLFHVHAHKEQCFFQFAPTFIPGTGIVAGEILESLWSSLNAISPMARTATLAHRAETIDDHANDSNHKKTLGMVSNLCRIYRHAVDMLEHARTYHLNLSHQAGDTAVDKWTADIENAEHNRRNDVTVMNIYAAKLVNPPSEIRHPASEVHVTALDSWMELSLGVEERQLEIQAKVRQLGRNPGINEQQAIQTAREQLTVLIQELRKATYAVNVSEIHNQSPPIPEPLSSWDDIANEPVPGGPNSSDIIEDPACVGPVQIEDQILLLPSNGNVEQHFSSLELKHRISHADHHLNRVRDLIAEKSFQYSHVIRVAPRKAVNTRSRAEVKKLNLRISVLCRLYSQCRARIILLGAPSATMDRFKVLTVDDIKASTAIINPNEPGSTQLKLSWIWQSAGSHLWDFGSGMEHTGAESRTSPEPNVIEFRRVHWLRSRAQLMRWQEELTLTGYEMQWTVRYFRYMSEKWIVPPAPGINSACPPGTSSGTFSGLSNQFLTAGALAYWNRKKDVWANLSKNADMVFKSCNPAYISPL